MTRSTSAPPVFRSYAVLLLLGGVFALLALRVIHLQTAEHERLRLAGDARYLRGLTVPAERGPIVDRNGEVLAISTPVDSLWAIPAKFCAAEKRWPPLLALLKMDATRLHMQCRRQRQADFMYIQRHLSPMLAQRARALNLPGVRTRREYKRFYPGGPAGAHLLGFTNVDDVGQEGLERAFEAQLGGREGRILALKDRAGNYVESVENLRPVQPGAPLVVSIDQRVQSLAAEYLRAAVQRHKARGGSIVVLAIPSGEILGMVNSPQFNPNDRRTLTAGKVRNRAVTDVFEPGSAVKPFSIAMALESGQFNADTLVNTAPGAYSVDGHVIRDTRDFGEISVFEIVARSSNVGAAKIALQLPYDDLLDTFARLGFGRRAANLPGEAGGTLKRRASLMDHAALSYGYGLAVTTLQLARAYSVFATDGQLLPVTLRRQSPHYRAAGRRVFQPETARVIRDMLAQAASADGTAAKAQIARFSVGGKTGTVHKLIDGNYQNQRYISIFAGLAPLHSPRFVMAVTVDDPRGPFYYGGDVAAPVFASLAADLLRLYNVPPDNLGDAHPRRIAAAGGANE